MSVDLVAELLGFIEVAHTEWLGREARDARAAAHADSTQAMRRERLRKLVAAHDRIAEVDAQIALVEITPSLPGREEVVAKLLDVRRALLGGVRRRR